VKKDANTKSKNNKQKLKFSILALEFSTFILVIVKLANFNANSIALHERAFSSLHLLWQNLMIQERSMVAPAVPLTPKDIEQAKGSLKELYQIIWQTLDKERITCGQSPNIYNVNSISVTSIKMPDSGITQGNGEPCTYLVKDQVQDGMIGQLNQIFKNADILDWIIGFLTLLIFILKYKEFKLEEIRDNSAEKKKNRKSSQ
jgi:hypothetical protein